MPILKGILERIFDRLYDTMVLAPGSLFPNRQLLFVNPIGTCEGGRQRFWEHTNMVMSGYLPHPIRFLAKRIRIEILAAAEADLDLFKQRVSVRFQVGCKRYFEAPASTLILEDWIRHAVAAIGANQAAQIGPYLDDALKNGNLGIAALVDDQFHIEPQESFSAEIRCDEPFQLTQPFVFRLFLEGPEFRAVC